MIIWIPEMAIDPVITHFFMEDPPANFRAQSHVPTAWYPWFKTLVAVYINIFFGFGDVHPAKDSLPFGHPT